MKHEEKNRMSRKGLVKFFKGLTELIEKNELKFGDRRIGLGDSLDVEVEYKEKKGRAKLEVEVKWDLKKDMQKLYDDNVEDSPMMDSISEVKQSIKRSFNAMRETLGAGGVPSESEALEFLNLSKAFNKIAQGEGYEAEMTPYMERVKALVDAVKNKRTGELGTIIEELRAAKKSCHKTYRWKEE